ncbi:hypothetical protein [Umezawaea sp. NPDC059074]|uniref:hypothetical protein n=1 Tax=Umezawaea sp. NPDC059074 TaxID=3346716 RepID=UPI003694128A
MSPSQLPFSKSQAERLGKRLVANPVPDPGDLDLLREFLAAYDDTLSEAVERVERETGFRATPRLKNTPTILEKLRRQGGLPNIQDLAGMRIVEDFDLVQQLNLGYDIKRLFSDAPKTPRLVNRVNEPMFGYRAVHVVVYPNKIPVEVQIRTKWQSNWANLNEKIADVVGRGIRYGKDPDYLDHKFGQLILKTIRDSPRPHGKVFANALQWLESRERLLELVLENMGYISELIAKYEWMKAIQDNSETLSAHPGYDELVEAVNQSGVSTEEARVALASTYDIYTDDIIDSMAKARNDMFDMFDRVGRTIIESSLRKFEQSIPGLKPTEAQKEFATKVLLEGLAKNEQK